MNEISDEELYRRYCKGDTQAFELVYERYCQSLYLFLLRSCNTRADAEDLYQEVWSRIIATPKPDKRLLDSPTMPNHKTVKYNRPIDRK
ncbi:MAG: hypothetical protein KZQ89_13565 [Candidatus Thiodiazotropha sp. (ex Lucinoma kastoroae)]|nr:hypothetical protein [Candidatus Thiodiazotropha sp. (ex Lucinoma kastoroae)]